MIYSDYLTFADPNTQPKDIYDIFIMDETVNQVDPFLRYQFFNFINTNSINTVFEFLDFHLNRYTEGNPGKEKMFLLFVKECVLIPGEIEFGHDKGDGKPRMKVKTVSINEGRKETVKEWIETKNNEIETNRKPLQAGEKIKWNGTPSQFGYLFLELVARGFIDTPLYNGETNFKGLARQCYQYFDITTTPGNIEKEMNPNKNTLSDIKRAKFTIPNLSDLA